MSLLNFEEAFGSNALNDDTGLTIYGPYWHDVYNYPEHLSALTYAINTQRRDIVRQIKQLEKFHTRTADIFETSTYKLVKVRLRDVKLRRIKLNDGNRLGPKKDKTYNALGQTEWFWYEFKLPNKLLSAVAVCDKPGKSDHIFTLPGEARLSEDGFILEIPLIEANEIFEIGSDEFGQYMKLWFYMPKTESRSYRQEFCRWLGSSVTLSDSVKKAAEAIELASINGSSELVIRQFIAAAAGCSIALEQEKVLKVEQSDNYGYLVVTDKNSYTCSSSATPTCSVGKVFQPGDFVFDNVTWFNFDKKIPDWLRFINFPSTFFGTSYDIAVINLERDIVYGYDSSGKFKMRFPVVVRFENKPSTVPIIPETESVFKDKMFAAVYKNIDELEIQPNNTEVELALDKFWEAFDSASEGKLFNYICRASGYSDALTDLTLLDTELSVLQVLSDIWLQYGYSVSLIERSKSLETVDDVLKALNLVTPAWKQHLPQVIGSRLLTWEDSLTVWEIAQLIWG